MKRMQCPICHLEMIEDSIPKKKAFKYENCIRKCLNCRLGASNNEKNPTYIYENYQHNIPSELLENLEYTLNESNNKRNHHNKKIRMGYSTSEDAISWIFIKCFIKNQKLNVLQEIFHCKSKITEILMWGVPQINRQYENPLKDICRNLGENENSFSEPDIIVITEEEVIFIEVKVKSSNDKQNPDKKDFDRYLDNDFYFDKALAKKSKYYELIRNWTIAHYFSNDKKIRLINLAPNMLFYKESNRDFSNFISSLKNRENFEQLSWENVFQVMISNSLDSDIVYELKKRIEIYE